jgi:hypothetical protein
MEVFLAQRNRTGRNDRIHPEVVVPDQGSAPLNRRLDNSPRDYGLWSAPLAPRQCRLDLLDPRSVSYGKSPLLAILIVLPRTPAENSGDLPWVGPIVVLVEGGTFQLLCHRGNTIGPLGDDSGASGAIAASVPRRNRPASSTSAFAAIDCDLRASPPIGSLSPHRRANVADDQDIAAPAARERPGARHRRIDLRCATDSPRALRLLG